MSNPIQVITSPNGPDRVQHGWPTNAKAGIALQKQLFNYRNCANCLGTIRTIAGIDIGFEDSGRTTRAAAVVLDADTLEIIETHVARIPTRMPYIPGLLSFREVPAAQKAIQELQHRPDLLMVDGHGIAHPRGVGNATHLGLITGIPSIGIAKKRLTGTHGEVPKKVGEWTPLTKDDQVIGAVLRSRAGVKPVFVSSGYCIDLQTSLDWVKHCLIGYKLPKPTHEADALASRRRKGYRTTS